MRLTLFKTSLATLLLITTIGCSDEHGSNQESKTDKVKPLMSLKLKPEKRKLKIGERIILESTLKNISKDTLLINNRSLIGYEEGIGREIFFKIYDTYGNRFDLPGDHQACLLPMGIGQKNMQYLAPNESISHDIDVTLIYSIKRIGKIEIVGIYESSPYEDVIGVYTTQGVKLIFRGTKQKEWQF
ncbi:MAG: hypothetical protein HRT57_16215 [Crocinitomicaceae bacterium]|nr:hypothetical protein [Crocinitomicaceae bacterium]